MEKPFFSQPKFRVRRLCSNISTEPILVLFTTAILSTFPTFQNLIFTKLCFFYAKTTDIKACDNLSNATHTQVENETSMWLLYTSLIYEGIALFTSLFWGTISDIYGRKFVILICTAFATVNGVINIWLSTDLSLPMSYLLFGYTIYGLGGGFNTISSLCTVYIHDVTSESSRTKRILILAATACFGGTLGPIISGVLIYYISYAAVFLLIACMYVVSFFCACILLKDNQIVESGNIQKCIKKSESLITNFINSITKKRPFNQRSHIIALLMAKSLFNLTLTGVLGRILILYTRDYPLKLSAVHYIFLIGFVQFINGFGSMVGGLIITKVFGCNDLTLAIMGLSSGMIGYIVWGFSYHMWIVYLATILGMIGYLASAGMQSKLTKILDAEEQGKIFAVSATMDYLSGFLSPLIFNFLYPASRQFYNGLSFQVAAFFLFCSMLCVIYVKQDIKKQEYIKLIDPLDTGGRDELLQK